MKFDDRISIQVSEYLPEQSILKWEILPMNVVFNI